MIRLLLFSLLFPYLLHSQDSTIQYSSHAPYAFGLIVGHSSISNQSKIAVIPNALTCGIFEDGNSTGLSIGIFGELTVIPSFLTVSGRAYYSQHPGSLQSSQCQYVVYNQQTGVYDSLRLKNQYTVSLDRMLIDVGLSLYPIPDIPLYLRGGASIGFGISENSFERTQTIIEPAFVNFPNGSKTRIIEKGTAETNQLFGANASLGYHLHLSPTFSIMPEIGYTHAFSSLLKNEDWKYQSFDIKLGLAYRPLEEKTKDLPKETETTIIIADEIPPPPAQAIINPIRFASINTPDLELQQTIITQTFPILPYIFFDANSTVPNSIQTSISPNFREEQVSSNTLETYNNVLGIIAKRMLAVENSKITLIGNSDGKEKTNQKERKLLAQDRAQTIKDILVKGWGINPDRILIQSRDLPKILSNKEYVEGDAENRRVEIETNSPDILSPVIYSKFNEYIPLQNTIQLALETDAKADIQEWKLDINYKGKSLHSLNGDKIPMNQIDISLDSAIISSLGNIISESSDSVDIILNCKLTSGEELSSTTKQAIKNTKNTFEISRLSLIVFEYDESTLSDKNSMMMKEFLKKEIGPQSKIDITGSTDKLGEAEYNIELSQERANAVENFMRSVKGIGSSRMLFDNSLPEGRYYCRTVSIEVKNPIQSLPGK
jgi:outer membrane protein OmpA-like peptidoglycan-associated protein